jgi:glycogen debranching enzyme
VPRFDFEPCDIILSRAARPEAYFDKTGRRFAVLGTESGTFEAWAYPLKLVRNFEFSFLLRTSATPLRGRDLVRSVAVTPAATTLTYVHQSFTARAVFVTAVDEPGAVILLAVDSLEPLSVVCGFLPVLEPMWPAGLGGQYASWNDELKAYILSEPTRRNHAYIGSPAARVVSATPAHMLADAPHEFQVVIENTAQAAGRFIPVVLAGGRGDREDVKKTFLKLASDPEAVCRRAEAHHRQLRSSTLRVVTPDPEFNLAWEWAKAAYDGLLVDNPDLGRGLVAGLGLSGVSGRPGFGWFFGGDAYLNTFSLLRLGAFEAVRDILSFTRRWQRPDGKMAHEVSQSAGLIKWFEDYPYAYIHADTTPLYIAAAEEYVRFTGDEAFLRESWPSLKRAFDWCLGTDGDGDGLMDNRQAGLGALEFGSLTGIQTDIFLAAAWCRASGAMARLAAMADDNSVEQTARAAADKAVSSFRARFWAPALGFYVYAFNESGDRVGEVTPWPSFGLAWGLGGEEETGRTLERLCRPDALTDWGIRMLSSESRLYEPLNYNYGAVWPFLTGWLAAALYANDLPLQGHAALKANVGHTFDNGLGVVAELYSGASNVWPAEAVAHQGFSTGGVVLPAAAGLLGIDADARAKTLVFRPSFPADWREVSLKGIRAGAAVFDLEYRRDEQGVSLRISCRGGKGWTVVAAPAFGPGARVRGVRLNGADVSFLRDSSERVTRPETRFEASGEDVLSFDVPPFVEILPPYVRTEIGASSGGLRVESVRGDGRRLKAAVWISSGGATFLPLTNARLVRSVEGAVLEANGLRIEPPAGPRGTYAARTVVLHLE